MPIKHEPDPGFALSQLSLPWPGRDEPCPKCHGRGDVYFIESSADVVGGKRITCSACDGSGTTLTPMSRCG